MTLLVHRGNSDSFGKVVVIVVELVPEGREMAMGLAWAIEGCCEGRADEAVRQRAAGLNGYDWSRDWWG